MNNKLNIIKERFKVNELKEKQKEIIEYILNGNDCISILPTGYGKSLIFQGLSLVLEGITIVISPLIALMNDQGYSLERKEIEYAIFNSSIDNRIIVKNYENINKGKIKLIYVSPEKLNTLEFVNNIKDIHISLLVVDEAHTILWKDSFRESFNYIKNFIDLFNYKFRILAMTATATLNTIKIIKDCLGIEKYKLVKSSVIKKNIYYQVLQVKDKKLFLKSYFNKNKNDKILVYCLTRRKVEELYRLYSEYNVSMYHGGLDNNIKQKNQDLFSKGINKIMFSTNAFGMGIDISDIYHVIHYEIPMSLEDLVQQAGRASRDGNEAIETVLFSFKDLKCIDYFLLDLDKSIKKVEKKKVIKVIDFCLSKKCRQITLGEYFNEKIDKCNFCDNCLKKYKY